MVYFKRWIAGRFQRRLDVLGGRRCRICEVRVPSPGMHGLCDRAACEDEAALMQAFNGI